MSIEITDPDTERLVHELAKRMNVAPAEIVRLGAHALARDSQEDEAVERIVAEVGALPVFDNRSINELLAEEDPI